MRIEGEWIKFSSISLIEPNFYFLKNVQTYEDLGNTVSINGGRGSLSIKQLDNSWKNENGSGMKKSLHKTTGREYRVQPSTAKQQKGYLCGTG